MIRMTVEWEVRACLLNDTTWVDVCNTTRFDDFHAKRQVGLLLFASLAIAPLLGW